MFNIADSEINNHYVFRIFSLERFLDIFAKDTHFLSLVKPRLWNDPFENFLLQNKPKGDDGLIVDLAYIREKIYGQCWTFNEETDFMWRVYAPNGDGIKVKVKLQMLIEKFVSVHYSHVNPCYIGKVDYWPWEDIKKFYESEPLSWFHPTLTRHIVKSLFLKRPEFSAENEIRLIHWSESFSSRGSDSTQLSVNANELFEEVVVDPRMDSYRYNSIISIIKKVGYSGKISQSQLYSTPDLNIKI